MDRGVWRATVHGSQRARHNLVMKQQISHEYIGKSPKQNTSKWNPATYKKDYTSWPSESYPRNTRWLPWALKVFQYWLHVLVIPYIFPFISMSYLPTLKIGPPSCLRMKWYNLLLETKSIQWRQISNSKMHIIPRVNTMGSYTYSNNAISAQKMFF